MPSVKAVKLCGFRCPGFEKEGKMTVICRKVSNLEIPQFVNQIEVKVPTYPQFWMRKFYQKTLKNCWYV